MAVKVVLVLMLLAFVLSLVVLGALTYFTRKAELEHEKELKEMDQQEKLFEE